MRWRLVTIPASLLILVAALALTGGFGQADLGKARLVADTKADRGDKLVVRYNGRYKNEATEPGLFRFTGDMLSPTGEKIGTQIHQAKCSTAKPPPCGVFDVEETFRFPEGTLKVKAFESSNNDPQMPDHLLIGIHGDKDNVVEATGAFAGRTGRARMSGWHDVHEIQEGFAAFNDFWLIELNR